jgi:undecaprenyl-diphosphatase
MSVEILDVLKAIVIGLIQALTEFLPVSSSGHMVIAKTLLRVDETGMTIEVVTHFATALAVVVYLRKRILRILRAVARQLRSRNRQADFDRMMDARLFWLVILGSLPAGAAGLALHDQIERLFSDVSTTAIMLVATGAFVFAAGKLARPSTSLGPLRALIIGAAQAVAMVPGISRSGMTVGTGLLTGVERSDIFEFSLLLSLPAIIGAALLEIVSGGLRGDAVIILASAIPAFLGGYVAIRLLYAAIVNNRFHAFAYYLIPVGIVLLLVL